MSSTTPTSRPAWASQARKTIRPNPLAVIFDTNFKGLRITFNQYDETMKNEVLTCSKETSPLFRNFNGFKHSDALHFKINDSEVVTSEYSYGYCGASDLDAFDLKTIFELLPQNMKTALRPAGEANRKFDIIIFDDGKEVAVGDVFTDEDIATLMTNNTYMHWRTFYKVTTLSKQSFWSDKSHCTMKQLLKGVNDVVPDEVVNSNGKTL